VYASAADAEDGTECLSTSASDLAGPSDVFGKSNQINQEEAAERCGLHRTYYSGVERGVRNVSLVNIERISKGLRVSLPKLFSRLS
jgi:hypothetical protein